jgi:PKD repeat protein
MKLHQLVFIPLATTLLMAAPKAAAAGPAYSAPPCSGSVGQEVEIPISLITGGAEVCGVSADISFDNSRLAFKGATAGPAASASGKNLMSMPQGSGAVRLALIGYNSIPMQDGIAFVLRFQIQGTGSGSVGVSIRGGAATCAGQDLPPFVAAAAIQVQGGSTDNGTTPPKDGGKPSSGDTSTTGTQSPQGGSTPTTISTTTSAGSAATHPEESSSDDTSTSSKDSEDESKGGAEAKPLSIKAILTNKKGPSPLMVAFRAQVEGGKKPYTYAWDYGDDSDKGAKIREKHLYAKPGTYKTTLEIKDAEGETVTVEGDEITVQDPPIPEITQALLVKGEENWSLHLTGKKFQKGCTATVNAKAYPAEFADSQRVVIKDLPALKEGEVKVFVANPYGKPSPEVKATPKPDTPKTPGV